MMTTAPAAGLDHDAPPDFAQGVVALNVSLRFGGERQGASTHYR